MNANYFKSILKLILIALNIVYNVYWKVKLIRYLNKRAIIL